MSGKSDDVINHYLHSGSATGNSWMQKAVINHPHFTKISVKLEGSQPALKLIIQSSIQCFREMMPAFLAFDIFSKMGTPLGQAIPKLEPFIPAGGNEIQLVTEIELEGFVPGDYYLDAWIGPHYNETYDLAKRMHRVLHY